MSWRVGRKVPINVYDGDRPVCQCHNPEDAARIVQAIAQYDGDADLPLYSDRIQNLERERDQLRAELQEAQEQIKQDSIDLNVVLNTLRDRNILIEAIGDVGPVDWTEFRQREAEIRKERGLDAPQQATAHPPDGGGASNT